MRSSPSVPLNVDDEALMQTHGDYFKDDGKRADLKVENSVNLYLKTLSWPTEGRGLLHTLSPLLYSKEFKIRGATGSYYFIRDESQVEISRSTEPNSVDQKVIVRLEVVKDGVFLDDTESCSEMWEEVPKDDEGYAISIGNVLRFGSYKIRVVDIVLSKKTDEASLKPFRSLQDSGDSSSEHTVARSDAPSIGGPVCRVCFDGGESDTNSLLSPCSCSGSLRYVHVDCLRRWLHGQLQVKQFDAGGGSYLIRTIKCEICKSVYCKSVYESVLIPRPREPHIILEDLVYPNVPCSPRDSGSLPISKIHIIPIFRGKSVRIGRSKEGEVVLSDISVSRAHASLKLTDSGVRLLDLKSKFGTLVQLPSRIFHSSDSSMLRVQIGSSLVEISASSPSRLERILPDRLFQEKGIVKVVKCKTPNERIIEAERLRRSSLNDPGESPLSPAATLNQSFSRSPADVAS